MRKKDVNAMCIIFIFILSFLLCAMIFKFFIIPHLQYVDEYVKKVKSTKQKDRADFYSKVASTEKERKQATVNKNFFEKSGQGRTIEDLKKFNDKNKSKTGTGNHQLERDVKWGQTLRP